MRILTMVFFISFHAMLYSQTSFFKYYPSEEHDEAFCSAEDEDGNFFITGTRYFLPDYTRNNGFVYKIDSNGNLVQEISLQSENGNTYCTAINFINAPYERFEVTGNERSLNNNDFLFHITLWQIDNQLNILSKDSFCRSNTNFNVPEETLVLNDSVLYVLSALSDEAKSIPHLSMLKIGLPADSLAYYQSDLSGVQDPSDLIYNLTDSTIVVTYGGSLFKDNSYTKLLKLDANLNHLSTYDPDAFLMNNSGLSTYTANSFLLTSTTTSLQNDYPHLITTEFNYNFELMNSIEVLSNPDTLLYCGGAKNTLVLNNEIWSIGIYNAIPGQYPWQEEPSWIQINRINGNFELIDQHFYGGDAYYISFDIKPANDGGAIIVGSRYDAHAVPFVAQKDPFVLKVNSEGLIVNVDNPALPLAQEAIVLPNPGREYLRVKLAVQHKSAQFQLFDLSGKLVLEARVAGDMQQIATSQLGCGTYVYRITAQNRVIGSGKWVKE